MPFHALEDLAVIVPITPTETTWAFLLEDLKYLPDKAEILFVGPKPPHGFKKKFSSFTHLRWIYSPLGRGKQLNKGAQLTQKKFLWFLHADSKIPLASLKALDQALYYDPLAIYYLDLEFLSDGPALTKLNAWGAGVRSKWFSLPFGDQSFCLSRQNFYRLQGFPEKAPYGEDHLFIWKAKRACMAIRSVNAKIYTSARKYQDRGWIKTTLTHWVATAQQAIPEWFKLLFEQAHSSRKRGSSSS